MAESTEDQKFLRKTIRSRHSSAILDVVRDVPEKASESKYDLGEASSQEIFSSKGLVSGQVSIR